jgi:hypothetical protein
VVPYHPPPTCFLGDVEGLYSPKTPERGTRSFAVVRAPAAPPVETERRYLELLREQAQQVIGADGCSVIRRIREKLRQEEDAGSKRQRS